MIVFPAIDLAAGQVVRLRQGDPAAQTVYGTDPAATAQRWAAAGAQWLHVVNLDGALGTPVAGPKSAADPPLNLQRLQEIHAAVRVPIQYGGGLRTLDDIARGLDLGASRVVLGTVALRQPELVADALARFGREQIVVGIDAREGKVAVQGWLAGSEVAAVDLARRMADIGVPRVVFTDIARDGMLQGVNVAATAELAQASGLAVIASGGVAGLDDIRALAAAPGIEGVIVGQALYTGALDLAEVIAAARSLE